MQAHERLEAAGQYGMCQSNNEVRNPSHVGILNLGTGKTVTAGSITVSGNVALSPGTSVT